MPLSTRVRVRIRVRIRFSVWLVSCYARVFLLRYCRLSLLHRHSWWTRWWQSVDGAVIDSAKALKPVNFPSFASRRATVIAAVTSAAPSPNSTWLVTSRLDTTRHVQASWDERVERVDPCRSSVSICHFLQMKPCLSTLIRLLRRNVRLVDCKNVPLHKFLTHKDASVCKFSHRRRGQSSAVVRNWLTGRAPLPSFPLPLS